MVCMETIALILATAVSAASLTWFLCRWFQPRDAVAQVWREGYLAGVADERTSAAWDVPGYGPNRTNPYGGSENGAGDE